LNADRLNVERALGRLKKYLSSIKILIYDTFGPRSKRYYRSVLYTQF
jgi:hypothetical protein